MADAAMEFLLNNLKDLLIYRANLLSNTKKNIESLEKDLRHLKGFLNESLKSRRNNEITKAVDWNIREAVYDVEDAIDAFVTHAHGPSHKFWKHFFDGNTSAIAQKVENVKQIVQRAKTDLPNIKADTEGKSRVPEVRHPRVKDVMHFEDETKTLIDRLTKETDYFDVVGLVGMFGLGKTTLAWKVFNHPKILYEFPIRIWLSISKEFSDKDIFLTILKEFTTITDYLLQKDEKVIAQIVSVYLETKSFLIVMDDVWSPADWDRLKDAMPNDNKKGKVLITSRIDEVGNYVCNPRHPHKLRLFTDAESWELLRREALHKLDCPPQLEKYGQRIARGCKGLPLAVVVIGGFLAAKYSALDSSAQERAWKKVSEQLGKYLNADQEERIKKFIDLSYDILPHHLRVCFLYIGMFPEAFEIPTSKLIPMWIAEGFIQQSDDSTLEETGEEYLADLINRNLVIVETLKPDGKVKTCRIHDALRNFCRKEAAEENFLQEVKFNDGDFIPQASELDEYRRLSIHSNCLEFIASKPDGPRVRSFVCFSKDKLILPSENVPDILEAFKLVRVLDVNCITFPKLKSILFELVHVKYIALSFDLSTLPSKFNQLQNLQTLIVDTTSSTFEVQADIWKFIRLRVFKTNVSTTLPKPSKDSKHGKQLQTLGTISVNSCTTELFQQARNLKKLGIRGELSLLFDKRTGAFGSLGNMRTLQNLKLINDVDSLLPPRGKLNSLPQFPSKLKSLTLRATYLDWSNMATLGLLAKLEVLKLKDKAFMGNNWVATDGGFPHLEVLVIKDTDLKAWAASSSSFPRLRGLVLWNCEKLLGVPAVLGNIETFQMLELNTCTSAVASTKIVKEAKMKAHAAFKLSIFPPTDNLS